MPRNPVSCVLTAFTVAATLTVNAAAQEQHRVDLTLLARGADRVVVATVARVEPVFQSNEFGDKLIVSRTHLQVNAELKSASVQSPTNEALVLELEGGTIGELSLKVSDLPRLERGERAVIFLHRNSKGANVPHGRGDGILRLDSNDRVKDSALSLAEIRKAVEQAR